MGCSLLCISWFANVQVPINSQVCLLHGIKISTPVYRSTKVQLRQGLSGYTFATGLPGVKGREDMSEHELPSSVCLHHSNQFVYSINPTHVASHSRTRLNSGKWWNQPQSSCHIQLEALTHDLITIRVQSGKLSNFDKWNKDLKITREVKELKLPEKLRN